MITFVIVFLLLYGGMHLFLLAKIWAADLLNRAGLIVSAFFLLLMVLAPLIIRYIERSEHASAAQPAAWVGYSWMGWILLWSAFTFAYDLWRAGIYVAGYISHRDLSFLVAAPRSSFLVILGLSLMATGYGFFEARNIRTEHLQIVTTKLPSGINRLRIVQISDVHIGLILREARLKQIAGIVKAAEPDIFVSTGDLVDGQICGYNGFAAILDEIRPKYGKYAVTGNHEFYAGLKDAKCFTEDSGFTLLRGQSVSIGNVITIAGVDDPAGKQVKVPVLGNEKDLLADIPSDRFRLLLKHRPLINKDALGLFDLQLSGHVHKGQIFPFSILTWLYYPVQAGYADLGGKGALYVSRGTGTWGPPVRFLAPPEITVIDLVKNQK
ncbi:MAG: metallophosphoesterase [Thermodesulfovibrionales bacterium]